MFRQCFRAANKHKIRFILEWAEIKTFFTPAKMLCTKKYINCYRCAHFEGRLASKGVKRFTCCVILFKITIHFILNLVFLWSIFSKKTLLSVILGTTLWWLQKCLDFYFYASNLGCSIEKFMGNFDILKVEVFKLSGRATKKNPKVDVKWH